LRFRRLVGVALAAYWIFLFASTHVRLPQDTLPRNTDKAAHFAAYALLAFLLGLWMSLRRPMTAGRYVLAFAIIAAYGILDELTQIPVGRTADVWDWAADCVGAVLGIGALWLIGQGFRATSLSGGKPGPAVEDRAS